MSSAVPFLIWLLCVGVAALIIGIFIRNGGLEWPTKALEGFNSSIIITACPSGSTTYITASGDTNCCDGDVVNKQCNGTNMCSLSPSIAGGLQSCSDWLSREWKKRGDRFCPQSLPNYFGSITRDGSKPEGCSESQCTADGSSPSNYTVPQCKIYTNQDDELGKVDSCTNIKALNDLQCPLSNASKQIIPTNNSNISGTSIPALLSCAYVPEGNMTNGMPTNCYDFSRAKKYLNVLYVLDGKRDAIADMNMYLESRKNVDVIFCSASKAYYVDRTLSQADAKGLPGSSENKKC
jgi:hypothetical protein